MRMTDKKEENPEIKKIKDFVNDKRFDDAANIIALYLGDSTEENYLEHLEDVIETLLLLHGGKTVLRFLIEHLIIDIPSILENLSKRDSVLRYSFLLLLKPLCENECDLFLPYSEELLNSDDPNVREAVLQLIIFMAAGVKEIEDEALVKNITTRLQDEKEFVIEKAIQALKAIGRNKPSFVTKIITSFVKEHPEVENLKIAVDNILKSIVTVEKIEEIVEEEDKEEISEEDKLDQEEAEILDKELELKRKELEIKKKKLQIEEKEKAIEEKLIKEKEKSLKMKEVLITQESKITPPSEEIPKKVSKKIKKEEDEIIDKTIELKKKELEIKKKKLELELKEREMEELAIQEREKTLKLKEELMEQENVLSQVELELKQKMIKEKERKILEEEMKRADETIDQLEKKTEDEQEKD